MRIVCLSDTHGRQQKLVVPEGDLLLHAGDLTSRGDLDELEAAADWLRSLPHPNKVLIAGNHDFCLEQAPQQARSRLEGLVYLQDQAAEIEGLKIYGSPWQPWFHDWAFNLQRGSALRQVWQKIPESTQILLTHGPPQGILDQTYDSRRVGCEELALRVRQVRPSLHVFGHIHEAYGESRQDGCLYLNACVCDLRYRPVQLPWIVEWDGREMRRI